MNIGEKNMFLHIRFFFFFFQTAHDTFMQNLWVYLTTADSLTLLSVLTAHVWTHNLYKRAPVHTLKVLQLQAPLWPRPKSFPKTQKSKLLNGTKLGWDKVLWWKDQQLQLFLGASHHWQSHSDWGSLQDLTSWEQ